MADENDDVIEIRLDRKSKTVKINDELFTVREMDGIELGKWRSEMSGRLKYGAEGNVVGVKTHTGTEASLISYCLYNSKDELVKRDTIVNWPVSAQNLLLKICVDINGLDPDAVGKEKNG